ncbi:MAG: CTP synthase, partial [Bacteroidota bacterium]
EVIQKERAGAYLGKTVQVVPHIIDEIKRRMTRLGETGAYDIVITEIGGTVGDIESQPYLEAIRQLIQELGRKNTCEVHLTLVPYLAAAGELKTKPTQHSVKLLLSYGLQPDILVCRSEHPLDDEVRSKIALFCNVDSHAVITAMDAESIYEVPLLLHEQEMDSVVAESLNLEADLVAEQRQLGEPALNEWIDSLRKIKHPTEKVRVALVGKYVEHQDAYKSISESFILAGASLGVQVEVRAVLSDDVTAENVAELLDDVTGVLVAPGFGDRGIEGKIQAVKYARENDIPFFGICLGLQCAVIEFARHVCGWEGANSTEFDPETPYPIIDMMEDQKQVTRKGGTMRLGAYTCEVKPGTKAFKAYGDEVVNERHRHRFEVNNTLRYKLLENGMLFTGINPGRDLVEIIEVPEHRWFLGVQFHPEYQSTVEHPHPLFTGFLRAAIEYAEERDLVSSPRTPRRSKPAPLASADV